MGEQASAGGAGRALAAPRFDAGRSFALISLSALVVYVACLGLESVFAGVGFGAIEPWPIGGGTTVGWAGRLGSLVLALAIGWIVPGLPLALLAGGRADVVRSFVMGTAYVVASTLVFSVAAGGAPSRAPLVMLLALPSVALLVRGSNTGLPRREWLGALAAVVALTLLLWPKLAHEGLNGDGTEAYELARSLDRHRLPHWDLERWDPPGRFGTPAVNPFLTNSLLVRSVMTLAGAGELAARILLIPALVVGAIATARLAGSPGWSGGVYLSAVTLLYLLWSSYYVGYEPAFTDLAEPAATDTLTIALLAAGGLELARKRLGLSTIAFLLAAGVLYSASVLVGLALTFLAAIDRDRRAQPLATWGAALAGSLVLALALGAASSDLPEWSRQIRAEYVDDFVGRGVRQPGLPLLGLALLATGGLPLVVASRWRSALPVPAALFASAVVYLAIVLASAEKNLHYLAPIPFLMAPAAIAASRSKQRLAATVVVAAALVLSWPDHVGIHRETIELGRESCVLGADYEAAVLGADVVYEAFGRPGRDGRFHVGKHTFVRYALELDEGGCRIVLGAEAPAGTKVVARGDLTLAVDDSATLERWRSLRPPVPRSVLFPRRDVGAE